MPGGDLGRCYSLEIKQGESKGRRHKGRLQIDRQENAEPHGIKPEFQHDGGQNRHMDKGDFNEIEEKTDEEDDGHYDGQNNIMAVAVGQGTEEFPNQAVSAEAPEYQAESRGAAKDNEDHAGKVGGLPHDLVEHLQIEFFVGNGQECRAHCPHGGGFGGGSNSGKDGAQN